MFQKSIAAAAALAVAGFASAQSGGTSTQNDELVDLSGVSVRLAVGIPLEDQVRDNLGATLMGFGIEFQPTRSLLPSSDTYFAGEIFFRDFSFSNGYVTALTVNQRFYSTRTVAANLRRQYLFVGIGFAFTDADDAGGTSGALALRGGVGTEIGERLFFEAGVMLGAGNDRAKPNIISLSGGYRF